MPLYLTVEICSVIIPLVLSFDRKVAFYKKWKVLFPSIILTGILFVIIDIIFTSQGIWGFNPRYHSGISFAGIPLEEWLFFIVIPYASIFLHYVIIAYFPGAAIPQGTTRIITVILIIVLFFVAVANAGKTYTFVFFFVTIGVLIAGLFEKSGLLNRFYVTFPVILLPFLLVNGILTGSFTSDEVVWYNNSEITGIRIFTIPVEDFAYGFSLIFMNILLMNSLNKLFFNRQKN